MLQPEFIVYMWMVPVLLMIVVPASWSMFCMLYKALERSRLPDVRGSVEVSAPFSEKNTNIERRLDTRIQIKGQKAVVAQQTKCCKTHVSNISSKGICLSNIPQKMFEEANSKFKVIFRTRERDYTMLVQSNWKKSGNNGYMVGAEILAMPVGWASFVNVFSQPSLEKAA